MGFVCFCFILLGISDVLGERTGFCSTTTSLITGMNGVTDDDIYATSQHNANACNKNNIRIDSPPPNAWCMMTPNNTDLIQITFRVKSKIMTMITSGRGSPSIQYLKTYHMKISSDGVTWSYVTDDSNNIKVFPANTDTNTLAGYDPDEDIETKYIRVIPQTWYSFPSFRLEVKGCQCECQCDNGLIWKGIRGYVNGTLPILRETNAMSNGHCGRACYNDKACGGFAFLPDLTKCVLYSVDVVNTSTIQQNAYSHVNGRMYFFKYNTMCCV